LAISTDFNRGQATTSKAIVVTLSQKRQVRGILWLVHSLFMCCPYPGMTPGCHVFVIIHHRHALALSDVGALCK
jgi:hypothetical protein